MIHLVDRTTRHLMPVAHPSRAVPASVEPLLGRLQAALAAYRALEAPPGVVAELRRGALSDVAWLERLRARIAHEAAYRAGEIDRDALVRAVESPAAPEDARGAAALLLRWLGLDADERARLAEVRAGTASPRMRVALDAALGGDEVAAASAARRLRG